MAYTEEPRGARKSWRVRYKRPDGTYASASADDAGNPFTTKTAALNWGRDQEAKIRGRSWRDPRNGGITLAEWITKWWPSVDVGLNTEIDYAWHIERHILPAFGEWALADLTTTDIAAWEIRIRTVDGFAPSTAMSARTLLITILGDAVPQYLDVNPAVRPRRRGRKTGASLASSGERRVYATPLQVLLLAERSAIITGTCDNFVLTVTLGWTGCRWSEAIGMERAAIVGDVWELRRQLYYQKGRWWRTPPKDDSDRDVDLPPFLVDLLAWQKRHGLAPCRHCPPDVHEPGIHMFGGVRRASGGHYDDSNYGPRVWRPAADGWYPERAVKGRLRPAQPVLIDARVWPGAPILPAWPAADPAAETWSPPRGRGIKRIPPEIPVASWLPIRTGLVPHGLRHGHATWLDDDGIPAALQRDRVWGGRLEGMRGVYVHVSPDARAMVKSALQRRWETALRQRAAMCPTSPVPLLNELLEPYRADETSQPAAAS